jgi:hypothetical protein
LQSDAFVVQCSDVNDDWQAGVALDCRKEFGEGSREKSPRNMIPERARPIERADDNFRCVSQASRLCSSRFYNEHLAGFHLEVTEGNRRYQRGRRHTHSPAAARKHGPTPIPNERDSERPSPSVQPREKSRWRYAMHTRFSLTLRRA